MIPKINGSTQMPAQIQQYETETAQTNTKKSDMNGPMAGSNDQSRTAPPVQPRNPAAETKYEGHRIAADLNAKLDANGEKSKPPETNGFMEDALISHLKAPDRSPVGEEGPAPEGKAVKALQWMVDGIKSDPPKNPEASETKFGVWCEDTKL